MNIQLTINFEHLTQEQREAFAILVGWAPPLAEERQESRDANDWMDEFRAEWLDALNEIGISDKRLRNSIVQWANRIVWGAENPDDQMLYQETIKRWGHLPSLREFLRDERLWWSIRNVGEKKMEMLRQIRRHLTKCRESDTL